MITLKKEMLWSSNDYWTIDEVELYFDDKTIEKIKKFQEILIKNPEMDKIVFYFHDYEFEQEEDAFIEIKCDVSQLYVFKGSVLFYCQDKWDSANQMEFDYVLNSELGLSVREEF